MDPNEWREKLAEAATTPFPEEGVKAYLDLKRWKGLDTKLDPFIVGNLAKTMAYVLLKDFEPRIPSPDDSVWWSTLMTSFTF